MHPTTFDEEAPPADASAAQWRDRYAKLTQVDEAEHIDLLELQANRLETNHDEAEADVENAGDSAGAPCPKPPEPATFAQQNVYRTPSAYIASLTAALPAEERLTRDQTLFMARFAQCCDAAWEDEGKPPSERRVWHLLLLGQGGSGKTHVVQKLVFEAVRFIWPPLSNAEPTLMVVASSNAQAKNISTVETKARTLHNASAMRVHKLSNDRLRPGKMQATRNSGTR